MWSNPRIPYQMWSDRPRLEPLQGRPLIVNPVVAIEYWPFDRPMPRGILSAPHGRPSEPLDILQQRSDTIFVTSGEIADWFLAADKSGRADLEAAMRTR